MRLRLRSMVETEAKSEKVPCTPIIQVIDGQVTGQMEMLQSCSPRNTLWGLRRPRRCKRESGAWRALIGIQLDFRAQIRVLSKNLCGAFFKRELTNGWTRN